MVELKTHDDGDGGVPLEGVHVLVPEERDEDGEDGDDDDTRCARELMCGADGSQSRGACNVIKNKSQCHLSSVPKLRIRTKKGTYRRWC